MLCQLPANSTPRQPPRSFFGSGQLGNFVQIRPSNPSNVPFFSSLFFPFPPPLSRAPRLSRWRHERATAFPLPPFKIKSATVAKHRFQFKIKHIALLISGQPNLCVWCVVFTEHVWRKHHQKFCSYIWTIHFLCSFRGICWSGPLTVFRCVA